MSAMSHIAAPLQSEKNINDQKLFDSTIYLPKENSPISIMMRKIRLQQDIQKACKVLPIW